MIVYGSFDHLGTRRESGGCLFVTLLGRGEMTGLLESDERMANLRGTT